MVLYCHGDSDTGVDIQRAIGGKWKELFEEVSIDTAVVVLSSTTAAVSLAIPVKITGATVPWSLHGD